MKYLVEKKLCGFKFWGQAKENAEELTEEQFDTIENIMEDLQPEGWTEIEINDFFWFEFDKIKKWLGIEDEDEEED